MPHKRKTQMSVTYTSPRGLRISEFLEFGIEGIFRRENLTKEIPIKPNMCYNTLWDIHVSLNYIVCVNVYPIFIVIAYYLLNVGPQAYIIMALKCPIWFIII